VRSRATGAAPPRLELLGPDPAAVTERTKLLFVHGLWHGAWCWEGRLSHGEGPEPGFRSYFLDRGFGAYALSLRGHGRSDGRASLQWNSIEEFADDVAWAVNEIGGPVVVVAHSMGSHVLQAYLERPNTTGGEYPVVGAVLLAPVPPAGVLRLFGRLLFSKHFLRVMTGVVTGSVWPVIETPPLGGHVLFSPEKPLDEVTRYYAPLDEAAGQKRLQDDSFRAFLDMLVLNRPDPEKVKQARETLRVLVLGGEGDVVFLPQEVEATARAYGTTPGMFPVAHDMMLEARWEDVARAVGRWLEENGFAT
jgi:pimeloyl-ACP methyl ester carboxylesterase